MKIGKIGIFLFCTLTSLGFGVNTEKLIKITAMPKSGTKLLLKCIEEMTGKRAGNFQTGLKQPETYYSWKYFNGENPSADARVLNILHIRDPRDILTILYKNQHLQISDWQNSPKREDLAELMQRETSPYDLPRQLRFVQKALTEHPKALLVRYEKLIGPEGGGSLNLQMQELRKIAAYLGCDIDEDRLLKIRDSLWPYHEENIGIWKETFTNRHILLFKRYYQQDLEWLKYEANRFW